MQSTLPSLGPFFLVDDVFSFSRRRKTVWGKRKFSWKASRRMGKFIVRVGMWGRRARWTVKPSTQINQTLVFRGNEWRPYCSVDHRKSNYCHNFLLPLAPEIGQIFSAVRYFYFLFRSAAAAMPFKTLVCVSCYAVDFMANHVGQKWRFFRNRAHVLDFFFWRQTDCVFAIMQNLVLTSSSTCVEDLRCDKTIKI